MEATINPAAKRAYGDYKLRSKKRGFSIELSIDEFITITTKPCHYCECLPENRRIKGKHIFYYNGIDRIDSDKGYLYDNIVACCWTCNRAKGDMSYAHFRRWIKRIASAENRRTDNKEKGDRQHRIIGV